MGAGKSSRPFRKTRPPGRETRGVQAQTRIPKSSVPRGREADAERDNRQNESKRARLDAQAEYMRQKSETRGEDREPGQQKRPRPNRRKAKRMAQMAQREKRRKMEAKQQSEYDRRKGF